MQDFSREIQEKARHIKLLVLDVDGVLSDGKLYYSESGDEIKSFNILDGQGIKLLLNNHIEVAIITKRESKIVSRRAKELGINTLVQGSQSKLPALDDLLQELKLGYQETAYIGDDLPDLACMRRVGFAVTVPNAHPVLQQYALCCTQRHGGEGAVREICDLILQAQDKLDRAIEPYL
jgi:3-deoxy-D-manno-octulosonate 8-phosphate phosphatase (KDO 8-P phosphatase)